MYTITEQYPKTFSKSSCYANELELAFLTYEKNITILSLDCFDTLLWRKTAKPFDVFINLQQKEKCRALGMRAALRLNHEARARALQYVTKGYSEVKLKDIYQYAFPDLDEKDIHLLIEEELAAEMDACYAFQPMVELMRLAKQHHKKIIIVSDTYLTQKQLVFLLQEKLPGDVFKSIDHVFCSSEFNQSKTQGIFHSVMDLTNSRPEKILHIGDNAAADVDAPKKLNINTLQLMQFDDSLEQLSNMRNWAALLIDPRIRYSRGAIDLWRGLMACHSFSNQPEKIIGYACLGPIMYAFANYLKQEVDLLKNTAKRPKVLFLLRDSHLISTVCAALFGNDFGTNVTISRFAAYAASFHNKRDVEAYLSEHVFAQRFDIICKQLLLPPTIAESLIAKTKKASDPVAEFISLILRDEILQLIFDASTSYCRRLIKYLQGCAKIEEGDTLIFVDLGYRGTAQKRLSPILQEQLDIKVLGRYLLALSDTKTNGHAGLIDCSWCDDRTLTMLVNYIALFEQVNTNTQSSVIDYNETGQPVFHDSQIQSQQHEKLRAIQTECVKFAVEANPYQTSSQLKLNHEELRDAALAELTRFIFLPTAIEIDYLQSFQFDFNLGTDKMMNVFDLQKGIKDLRNRGLFFMEKNLESMRTNYPAELRAASLELSLSLMTQERFKGSLALKEISFRRETLPILLVAGAQASRNKLEAIPTFDGYYALTIPVGKGNFHVGVQFGSQYKWVEIFSAHLINLSAYLTDSESEYTQDVQAKLVMNQMIERDKNLFECATTDSFVAFVSPNQVWEENHLLRLVFRPIVFRET